MRGGIFFWIGLLGLLLVFGGVGRMEVDDSPEATAEGLIAAFAGLLLAFASFLLGCFGHLAPGDENLKRGGWERRKRDRLGLD